MKTHSQQAKRSPWLPHYLSYAGLSLKTRVGYRMDLLIGGVGIVLTNLIAIGLIGVVTGRYGSIAGWSFWELTFLYNLWLLAHGFYSTFFKNIEDLQRLIVSGEFDRYLLKPVRPLVQLVGSQFYFFGAGDWVFSITMLAISAGQLGLSWSLGLWLFFALTILCALIIETALSLAVNTVAFWFTRTDALLYLLMQFNYGLAQRYPIDLYQPGLRVILTFALPFAFMNFFPGAVLLGRADKFLFDPLVHYIGGPIAALVCAVVAALVWRVGLRSYQSAGG